MKRVSPITKCSIRKQFDERTVSIERERERGQQGEKKQLAEAIIYNFFPIVNEADADPQPLEHESSPARTRLFVRSLSFAFVIEL